MLIRRMLLGSALALGVMAGPAAAQDSPASVLPSVVERPTEVKGVQLPRTGGDLDTEVLAGVALTAAGLGLAVGARQRRRRFAAAHS